MRVLLSGSHGLIGSAIADQLGAAGHQVYRLIRGADCEPPWQISWDPLAGRIDRAALAAAGIEGVVHLAG